MARRFLPSLRRSALPAGGPEQGLERKVVLADYFAAMNAAGLYSTNRSRPWPVERAVAEAYERIVWIFKAVNAIAGHASRLDVQLKRGERVIDDHPLLDVLNKRANPMETGQQFRQRLSQQILLSKRGAFVELTRSRSGDIIRMDLLPPGRTCPVPGNGQELIKNFEVIRQDGSKRPIETENVRWLRDPHPLDPYSGVTPLEAAGLSVELDFFARLYNVSFLKNDARPGGVLAVNGEMGETEMDRIERRFIKGPTEAGKLTVINGEVSYVDLAARPRDTQYTVTSATAKNELLCAFGVPESILGFASERTYANAEQEEYNFWTVTMPPHLNLLATGFDEDSDDDLETCFDTSKIEVLHKAEITRRQEARDEFDRGLISADEYRDIAGYAHVDEPRARALYIANQGKAIVPTSQKDADALQAQQAAAAPAPGPGAAAPPPGGGAEGPAETGPEGSSPPGEAAPPPGGEPAAGGGPPPPALSLVTASSGGSTTTTALTWSEAPSLRAVEDAETKQERAGAEVSYDTDPRARERLEASLSAALTALVVRLLERTVARANSPKARKGTRHWQPGPLPRDSRIGTKELDAASAVDEQRWQAEAESAVLPVLEAAAASISADLLTGLGLSLPPSVVITTRTQAAQEVVGTVGEAMRKIAGQVTALIRDADQAGQPIAEIVSAIRAKGSHLTRWADGIATQAATAAVSGVQEAIAQAVAQEEPDRQIVRQWRTKKDDKVRPSHEKADGQIRPLGEPFEVGDGPLRFPGDPEGAPGETFGCRCNLNWRVKATGRYEPKPASEAALLATRRRRRTAEKSLVLRMERKAVGHRIPGTAYQYKVERHPWDPELHPRGRRGEFAEVAGRGQARFAVRADDARRTQGQNPSNFPHPVTGHQMGKSEIGDTYEALFETHGSHLVEAKYGEPSYRAIARAGGTGSRTTPLDFSVDHRGGEMKTLNAAIPNQKTAMAAASVRRKEQAVADAGLEPLLVVQVVDQKAKSVKVYAFEAFASKSVSRMDYLGEYAYTLDDFEAAQRKTGHHEKREARAAAQAG